MRKDELSKIFTRWSDDEVVDSFLLGHLAEFVIEHTAEGEQPAEDAPSGEPPKCDFCNRPRSDLVNVEAVMCSDCEKKWDKMREAGAKEGDHD